MIGELTEVQNFVMAADKENWVVAALDTEASAVSRKLVQDKLVHDLIGDAQATAGEASVQHVAGESKEAAVEDSAVQAEIKEQGQTWWQAVQLREASSGFFSQRDAGHPAEIVGTAEDHEGVLGDGSIQREEAKQLKILKTWFKF